MNGNSLITERHAWSSLPVSKKSYDWLHQVWSWIVTKSLKPDLPIWKTASYHVEFLLQSVISFTTCWLIKDGSHKNVGHFLLKTAHHPFQYLTVSECMPKSLHDVTLRVVLISMQQCKVPRSRDGNCSFWKRPEFLIIIMYISMIVIGALDSWGGFEHIKSMIDYCLGVLFMNIWDPSFF